MLRTVSRLKDSLRMRCCRFFARLFSEDRECHHCMRTPSRTTTAQIAIQLVVGWRVVPLYSRADHLRRRYSDHDDLNAMLQILRVGNTAKFYRPTCDKRTGALLALVYGSGGDSRHRETVARCNCVCLHFSRQLLLKCWFLQRSYEC